MKDPDRQERVEQIFHRLMNTPEGNRERVLQDECAGDDELLNELRSLLVHHDEAGSFLAEPAVRGLEATVQVDHDFEPPATIGPYRILERLGEGGMGDVYLAEQSSPIKRRVALKVIKVGMDTKEVIARFESERQALAMMSHANVARIFDAGSTENGRPYFAMEHVAGEHITTYCDRHRLDLKDRLKLFVPVCEAIHHAHQKGIIHRDIKPSNVLVAVIDGKPVPKVIDFGVAKAIQQTLTEKTIFTAQGTLVGTPAYMSPEQAEMTGLNVDTTSDVYSLGVLLYELLVGALPFDAKALREAGIAEIHRIIREVDPPKPSTRFRTLGQTATDVASRRRSVPASWQRLLNGELDWMTMRAMEKDRSRRYQSAYALSEDIDRYLHDEAVLAGPPSQLYRFKKAVARNKLGATFVATVLVLLIGFGVSMGILRQRAEEAREDAQARAQELQQVTDFQASMLSTIDAEAMGQSLYSDLRDRVAESLAEEGVADREAEAALVEFEETLQRANATDLALEVIDEQILSRAVAALEREFSDQPLVRAALQQTVAETYRAIGRYEPGLPLQEAALETKRRELGTDHAQTLEALNSLGDLHASMGKTDEAGVAYAAALEGSRRALGDDHRETLRSLTNMGDLLHSIGELDSALVYCRDALDGHRRAFGEFDPGTLVAANNLGSLYISMKKFEEALAVYQEALVGMRQTLGNDHPETLNTINNLGFTHQSLGNFQEARALYQEALEGRRRVLGDDHPKTLVSVATMASLLKSMGNLEEALTYYVETLEGRRAALGDEHPRTLNSIVQTGMLLRSMGRLEEAAPYYREAVAGMRKTFGEDHASTLTMTMRTGSLLQTLGRPDEAMEYARRALAGCRRKVGDEHRVTLNAVALVGELLLDQGRAQGSLDHMLRAEPAARKVYGEKHPSQLAAFLTTLGKARTRAGEFALAESNLSEADSILDDGSDESQPARRSVLTALVNLYDSWHLAEPGAGHDEKARTLERKLRALGSD